MVKHPLAAWIGNRVSLTGHFDVPVVLEDVRPLGANGFAGYECRVRQAFLQNESWKKHFKGREILRAFAGEFLQGMRYEYFRDLIISQMVNEGYQPDGMKAVLDQILAD